MNLVFVWINLCGKLFEVSRKGSIMAIKGYPVRMKHVVWRDIAGEVVIAELDNSQLHVLNKTASLIWSLSDGSRQMENIISEIHTRFEVTPEKAMLDAEKFCHELLDAGLVAMESHEKVT